jgi:peptide/nickel transport system substrate-binding protein
VSHFRPLLHLKAFIAVLLCLGLCGCSHKPAPDTLVMIIEASPNNLDPRVGTDAYSERIDELLFDALVRRDNHFDLQPWLAEKWEIPDPLTYIFHLRQGVRFHDGRPLTARDVKWTLDSVAQGKIRTSKTSTFRYLARVDTPDDWTVIVHLREPFAALLWNISDAAIGIVPYGSDETFARKPIGSGPFKFVSMEQDKDVIVSRNDDYWSEKPRVKQVRFAVIPDATTRALELRKGSADIASNALTADMIIAMNTDPRVRVIHEPGTIYAYLAMNLRDPILKDVRVRQALAYAMDRRPMIHYLWRDMAQPADSVLPPQSWAYEGDVAKYQHDPAKARALLDAAGYSPKNGVRFRLTMKTSTEETTRLLAVVLQQQLRDVGIALDIRTYEFATFYADVQKGAFQLYSLRWIGGNQDPDIFDNVFESTNTPPKRANRGHYANAVVDRLIKEGRIEVNKQKRKQAYAEIQKIVATELPYINLWYYDNVLVHTPRVHNLKLNPSGNYDFLREAELQP